MYQSVSLTVAQGVFGFYAGMNIVALIMIFFFVPETMKRTLEELDWIFAVPVDKFAKYQLSVVLPWFFKRYCLFQRNATKPPLYHFDHISTPEKEDYAENMVSDEEKRVQ